MPHLHTPKDPASYVFYHGSGEWSALYERETGRCVIAGDHDDVIVTLLANLGVTRVVSDAFMLGSGDREDVARTLSEVIAYAHGENLKAERYDELMALIRELQAEADALMANDARARAATR